jgi:hypothetical protein
MIFDVDLWKSMPAPFGRSASIVMLCKRDAGPVDSAAMYRFSP